MELGLGGTLRSWGVSGKAQKLGRGMWDLPKALGLGGSPGMRGEAGGARAAGGEAEGRVGIGPCLPLNTPRPKNRLKLRVMGCLRSRASRKSLVLLQIFHRRIPACSAELEKSFSFLAGRKRRQDGLPGGAPSPRGLPWPRVALQEPLFLPLHFAGR